MEVKKQRQRELVGRDQVGKLRYDGKDHPRQRAWFPMAAYQVGKSIEEDNTKSITKLMLANRMPTNQMSPSLILHRSPQKHTVVAVAVAVPLQILTCRNRETSRLDTVSLLSRYKRCVLSPQALLIQLSLTVAPITERAPLELVNVFENPELSSSTNSPLQFAKKINSSDSWETGPDIFLSDTVIPS
ncbi:unnamed protein product [Dovyalis caffra]|uniref:Uncharacterized protein n=1 Tax=Dovyalis caffra TaxID=77055 RepID=A0AAV1RB18_9ROSI|nr:unnamed protein product [Dovyalis caffra]